VRAVAHPRSSAVRWNRPRTALRREYSLYFTFNGVGLAIELGVLGLTKYGLGLERVAAINTAKLLGLALGTAFRFWAYRSIVFKLDKATIVTKSPSPAAVPLSGG